MLSFLYLLSKVKKCSYMMSKTRKRQLTSIQNNIENFTKLKYRA